MQLRSIVMVGLVSLALSACSYTSQRLADAQATPPQGTPFQQALHNYYLDRASLELAEHHTEAADHFILKAEAAGAGQNVPPDELGVWGPVPAEHEADLANARSRLVSALQGGAGNRNPDAAALAQMMFDCWLEEATENHQPRDIAACRDGFEAAMAQLGPAQATSFIIYFAFDSDVVDSTGMAEVDRIVSAANANPGARVNLTGFTDRAGSEQYNLGLSERRATSVVQQLTSRGVPQTRVASAWRGESDLAVPTGDGVPEQGNRRVEVTVQ